VIGLDTNVLVRFLVEDDAAQTERASNVLQQAIEQDSLCYVSDVVMCEIVWVLETRYKFKRAEIHQGLENFLRSRQLTFSSMHLLSRALDSYGSGRGDFSDYVIREHARHEGCEAVVTFDGDLLKESGFLAP
jgi:predicted nucleic-acid-binding protein